MTLKLFLIYQDKNSGYDTYDSVVVCAVDVESARNMTPDGSPFTDEWTNWASCPENVDVTYLGEAADGICAGVVCAAFNAG